MVYVHMYPKQTEGRSGPPVLTSVVEMNSSQSPAQTIHLHSPEMPVFEPVHTQLPPPRPLAATPAAAALDANDTVVVATPAPAATATAAPATVTALTASPHAQRSPSIASDPAQRPPTPPLTIATTPAEDDGSSEFPPEDEVCPIWAQGPGEHY